MKKKIKTIHVFTDYKHINISERFQGDYFDNTLLAIIPKNKELKKESAIMQFQDSKKEIREVTDICKRFNLVVLYDLESIKIRIALNMPSNIKIAWRFFGHELYDKEKSLYLSKMTKSTLKSNNLLWYLKCFKSKRCIINAYKQIISKHFKNKETSSFNTALKRIDFFLGLSELEYEYLNSKFLFLPEFVKVPIYPVNAQEKLPPLETKTTGNTPIVIIGNSKAIYNNHIDIIEQIEKKKQKNKYSFVFFFNYGLEKYYTKKIRQITKGKDYYILLENLMSISEFNGYYKKASALVLNTYRQMAMANIFVAIKSGVKVYLNKKNLTYKWLTNLGFNIYSIQDFFYDIENNNIALNQQTANNNLEVMKKLSLNYSISDFQKKLYDKII